MNSPMIKFIKTMLMGGFFFLIPVTVLLIIIAKIFIMVRTIALPLAEILPFDNIGGVGVALLIELFIILFFCFLAGTFYKTRAAKKLTEWIESSVLSNIPGYSFMKSTLLPNAGGEETKIKEVVMVQIAEIWQLAFVTDHLDNGLKAVYIPGAPDPWSGSLFFMTEDKIKKIHISTKEAIAIIKRVGKGSNILLKDFSGTDEKTANHKKLS